MYMNKFGRSLNRANDEERSVESLRGYVRNSALCLNPDHYDAKKRRIVRVATPSLDTDVANRGYVDGALVDRDKSLSRVRDDVEEVRQSVDELTRGMNSLLQNRVEILSKNVDSLQTSQRENEKVSARLQNEEERLSRSVDELSKASVRIESSLEDLKRQIRDTTVSKKTLEKAIEDIKDSVHSTTARTVRETTLSKTQLTDAIEELKETIDKRVNESRDRFDEASRKTEEASAKTRDDVVELSRNVGDLSTTSVRIELTLENLKQELRNTAVNKETLEKTIANLENKLDKRMKESWARFEKALKSVSSIVTDDKILGDAFHNLEQRMQDNVGRMVTRTTFDDAIASVGSTARKQIEDSATKLRETIEKMLESVRGEVERLSKSNDSALKDLNERMSDESLVTKEKLKQELERAREFTTGDILRAEEHLRRTLTRDLARQLNLTPKKPDRII